MSPCGVTGCDRATSARGWCKRHYEIWRRHGDAEHQVRAFHLIGTQAQNVADMISRGRIDRSGERNNAAKLTAQGVAAIRAKHAVGQSITSLSADFGVSVSQVKNIVNNKQWKEVS